MPIQLIISEALQITDGPHGLIAHFNHQSFPLTAGRAETILTNLFLHIRSGIAPARICEHLRYHQSTTVIDAHCPCCKLEGRLASGMGRRTADTFRAKRTAFSGTVQIRHIPLGQSTAQMLAKDKFSRAFEAAHANPSPQKIVKKRIEDLI